MRLSGIIRSSVIVNTTRRTVPVSVLVPSVRRSVTAVSPQPLLLATATRYFSASRQLNTTFTRRHMSTAVDVKSEAASSFVAAPGKTRIGWIGVGVMGVSMAGHLMKAGYSVSVNTRTKAKAQPLIDAGAKWLDTPSAVAKQSDIVFTMLGFPSDVREVYLTSPNSILSGIQSGAIVCDMTTTEPSLAKEIAVAFAAKGVHAIDAPVSGGDVGAKNATLSIMAGGHKPTLDAINGLLSIMGKSIVYQGSAGSGQHTKMCNQIVIASTMVGVCESLLYGYKAGLNLETVLQSIGGGAAACWTLANLAPRVLKRNFEPGFFVDHFVKDMGIALDEARRMKLSLPGLALANQLYVSVQAQGKGQKGTHALALALEHMNAVQPPAPVPDAVAAAKK